MLNNISILNLNTIFQYTFKICGIELKSNKLIIKLILMLISILKTARNLLRQILPQPGFEPN